MRKTVVQTYTQVTMKPAKQPANDPPRSLSSAFMCFFFLITIIEPDITLYSSFIPVLRLAALVLFCCIFTLCGLYQVSPRSFLCVCVGEVSEARGI